MCMHLGAQQSEPSLSQVLIRDDNGLLENLIPHSNETKLLYFMYAVTNTDFAFLLEA